MTACVIVSSTAAQYQQRKVQPEPRTYMGFMRRSTFNYEQQRTACMKHMKMEISDVWVGKFNFNKIWIFIVFKFFPRFPIYFLFIYFNFSEFCHFLQFSGGERTSGRNETMTWRFINLLKLNHHFFSFFDKIFAASALVPVPTSLQNVWAVVCMAGYRFFISSTSNKNRGKLGKLLKINLDKWKCNKFKNIWTNAEDISDLLLAGGWSIEDTVSISLKTKKIHKKSKCMEKNFLKRKNENQWMTQNCFRILYDFVLILKLTTSRTNQQGVAFGCSNSNSKL